LRITSGITTQGTISSVRPAEETEKTRTSPGVKKDLEKKRSPLLLALGGVVLLLGVGAFFGLRSHETPPAQAAPVAPPPAAAAATHFTLRIESNPPGADVREGDRVLGSTPFELSIDNDAVRTAPRVFTLVKDGFSPYAVTQGPSQEQVRVIAPLAVVPTLAVQSAAPRAGTAPPPTRRGPPGRAAPPPSPPSAAPAASASRPDLDIRMNR
jgi:serine/threonine-protein kinase